MKTTRIEVAGSSRCNVPIRMHASGRRYRPRAGAEVAQASIDPLTLDHVGDREPALLVEGNVFDAFCFRRPEIVEARIAAIGGDLSWHRPVVSMPFEHRHEALTIDRARCHVEDHGPEARLI